MVAIAPIVEIAHRRIRSERSELGRDVDGDFDAPAPSLKRPASVVPAE
jgi:hypothetical protein